MKTKINKTKIVLGVAASAILCSIGYAFTQNMDGPNGANGVIWTDSSGAHERDYDSQGNLMGQQDNSDPAIGDQYVDDWAATSGWSMTDEE